MRVRLLSAAATLLVTACLAPMDPARVPIGAVRVTLGDRSLTLDTIAVRRAVRVNAVALARDGGYELPIATFRYASSNTASAIVDSLGVVHAIAPGSAVISASASDGTRGQATVVVVPSSVDYDIPIGGTPGAITFSPDYTKAYVVLQSRSVAFIDAIGFFTTSTMPLDAEIGELAATGGLLYATHPTDGSVSVISTSTHVLRARIHVGGSPNGVVARGTRAWVATGGSQRIAVIDGESVTTSFAVQGAPSALALSGDGTLLYVAVTNGDAWSVAVIDASSGVERGRVALPGRPRSLALGANATGAERLYVVMPDVGKMAELTLNGAELTIARAVSIASGTGGVAARGGDAPLVVVSGSPLGIYDGNTLGLIDAVSGAGAGAVALRPDGLFVFVGSAATNSVRVIGL